MTWIKTRWGAIAAGTALFLVGITLGASGGKAPREPLTPREPTSHRDGNQGYDRAS